MSAPLRDSQIAQCEPWVLERAAEWIRRTQTGDIDDAQFDARSGQVQTRESVRFGSRMIAPLGDPLAIAYVERRTKPNGITTYRFDVTFRSGKVRFDLGLSADRKVEQRSFRPIPGEPSPLHDLMSFIERAYPEMEAPLPGETPEDAKRRVLSDILERYRERVAAVS